MRRWSALAVLSLVLGCSSTPVPRPSPAHEPTLVAKAREYQRALESGFLSKEGWVCYARPLGSSSPVYSNLPRQGEITGYQLFAEVARYRATQSPDAVYNINKILQGIELLFGITAVPGLPARAMAPSLHTDPSWKWASASHLLPDADPLTGYHYRADTPKEQVVVFLLALSEVRLRMTEYPALVKRASSLLASMADHLYEHDQSLVGRHGQKTPGGDFPMWVIMLPVYGELPLGHNALALLAAQVAAHDATQEPRFKRRALELLSNDIMERLVPLKWTDASHDTDTLCFISAHILLQSPAFPEKEPLRQAIRRLYRTVADERNVFWALISHDDKALADVSWVREVLYRFPATKSGSQQSMDPDIPTRWFSCHGQSSSKLPLDLDQRSLNEFLWTSCPYMLEPEAPEGPQEYAGTDYLCAYWMAVSQGVIQPTD